MTQAKGKPVNRQRRQRPITAVGGRSPARTSRSRTKKPRTAKQPLKTKARSRVVRNDLLQTLFPRAGRPDQRFGLGVLIALVNKEGTTGQLRHARAERVSARPGLRPKGAILALAEPSSVAHLMAGLAHPDRVRVARAVMSGANTHQALSEAVSLKTGPLYHHVRTLERAGVLKTPGRNMYELTELGRALVLVATVLATWDGERNGIWHVKRLGSKSRSAD